MHRLLLHLKYVSSQVVFSARQTTSNGIFTAILKFLGSGVSTIHRTECRSFVWIDASLVLGNTNTKWEREGSRGEREMKSGTISRGIRDEESMIWKRVSCYSRDQENRVLEEVQISWKNSGVLEMFKKYWIFKNETQEQISYRILHIHFNPSIVLTFITYFQSVSRGKVCFQFSQDFTTNW